MAITVVGGVYREQCVHPHWNEVYGSAGRAACAIAEMGTPVVLRAYMDPSAVELFNEKAVWLGDRLRVNASASPTGIGFSYFHDMAAPVIHGKPDQALPQLTIEAEKVVRFGMLEGEAVVHAEWAVYDPQNHRNGRPFAENGSTAKHLALVMNFDEARRMTNSFGKSPSEVAGTLAQQHEAEVVVIKMGARGALVWTPSKVVEVPAHRTLNVWKLGSGDCFVAHFANAWMHEGKTPGEAARIASLATAVYCETRVLPSAQRLREATLPPVVVSDGYREGQSRRVYLAGPFFDLAQIEMVERTRTYLRDMGLEVFSPYHDVGLGDAEAVVMPDLQGIESSDLVLAIADGLDPGTIFEVGYAVARDKPVVVYSERESPADLKMMRGSYCVMCSQYTTALYSTLWEAARI